MIERVVQKIILAQTGDRHPWKPRLLFFMALVVGSACTVYKAPQDPHHHTEQSERITKKHPANKPVQASTPKNSSNTAVRVRPKSKARKPQRQPPRPGDAFIAAAPRGLTINDLGKPYDINFVRLQGTNGRTLYPKAGAPKSALQGYMKHDFVKADSEQELAANASAWGITVKGGMTKSRRYASYRAIQIKRVFEVDDTTPQRRTPPHAVYYPWRIYVGHSYEMLFEGSAESFHVGVQANLGLYSGGIESYAEENNLRLTSVGHGLEPRGRKAIFAKSQQEIEATYRPTGKPVVILVEWRKIPGKRGKRGRIAWNEPKKNCAGEPGCKPCREWEFTYLEWDLPSRKPNGDSWDLGDNIPDAVLILKVRDTIRTSPRRSTGVYQWKMTSGLRISAGALFVLSGKDIDLLNNNDDLGSLSGRVGKFYSGGKMVFGNGAAYMTGKCVTP